GVIEITPETFPIDEDELSFLQDLTVETGRPLSFSAILDLPERDGVWEPVWSRLRAGRARGAHVVPQVSCRPMRFELDRPGGCAAPAALPVWKRSREARDPAALLADPEFRAAVRAQTLGRPDAPSSRRWATVVVEGAHDAAHLRFVGRTLADVAAARGGDVIDALFDLALADDLGTR